MILLLVYVNGHMRSRHHPRGLRHMSREAAMVIKEVENLCWWRVDLNLCLEVVLEQFLLVHVRFTFTI